MGEPSISSKIVVLLFSDIVGSVNLKTRLGDAGAARLVGRHDAIFRDTFRLFPAATLLQDTGDGFYARFETASDAVLFALRFQHAIRQEQWNGAPVKVRVGIHLGEVTEMTLPDGAKKLSGLAVDLAARVTSLGEGGQILLTRTAFDSARQYVLAHPEVGAGPPPEVKWVAHGPYVMKGSEDPIDVYEVGAEGESPLKAPEDSEKAKRAVKPGDEDVLGWRPASGLEVPDRKGWVLIRKLGEGGFGEVWLGEHKKTREHRAFKFCFDAERLRSFKRELTLFRVLRNVLGERDDIAHLYEVRFDKPPYFLESEFSECGNLGEWAGTIGGIDKLPPDERVALVMRVARAVAAAHSVGILHKDVKPSNILIHLVDKGSPRPRLTDFGIGVLTDMSLLKNRNITMTGMTEGILEGNASSRTGTRMYAPPESLTGAVYTQQGDVFALGVLLYQCVVGDLGKPLAQGWERDVADPLLREDIAACVAGDPSRRLSSAGELADRLEKLPQRRAAAVRAARARVIRRVAVAAALVFALAAGVATVMSVRERSLRIEAVRAREAERAQRERAEANLDAVRGLAHTFLYEFDDKIKDLRGATPARKLILTEAQAYLVKLQEQAGDDPTYLRDLADTHDQVGQLQGGLFSGARLGDSKEASESFSTARDIRQKLLQRFPNDARSHADMAKSLLRTAGEAHLAGAHTDALAAREDAAKALARAVELAPPPEKHKYRDARAGAIRLVAQSTRYLAEEAAAREEWDKADTLLAEAARKYAEASGHWRERVQRNREASAAPEGAPPTGPRAGRSPGAGPSPEDAMRTLGVIEDDRAGVDRLGASFARARAEAALKAGKPDEARQLLTTALEGYDRAKAAALKSAEEFEKLSAERPQSAELRRDVYLALHNAGIADMEAAKAIESLARVEGSGVDAASARPRHEAALANYQRALEITEGLMRADESNQQAREDVTICLNKTGNELRDLARLDDAEKVFARSLAMREVDFKADPTVASRSRLAIGFYKCGEIAERKGDAAEPGRRMEAYTQAEQQLTRSRDEFRAATGSDDHPRVKEVDAALEALRQKIAKERESAAR